MVRTPYKFNIFYWSLASRAASAFPFRRRLLFLRLLSLKASPFHVSQPGPCGWPVPGPAGPRLAHLPPGARKVRRGATPLAGRAAAQRARSGHVTAGVRRGQRTGSARRAGPEAPAGGGGAQGSDEGQRCADLSPPPPTAGGTRSCRKKCLDWRLGWAGLTCRPVLKPAGRCHRG